LFFAFALVFVFLCFALVKGVMIMSDKPQLTTEQKRKLRIEKYRALLQKEEARESKAARKERDGQLIAWGVMVEEWYKARTADKRVKIADMAKEFLKDRNLLRALAGFQRIEAAAAAAKQAAASKPAAAEKKAVPAQNGVLSTYP